MVGGRTMNPLPVLFEQTVAAAYRQFDDGVRRWRDVDFAEWLGLEQPRNIRQLIEANRAELEEHGKLHTVRAVSGERGPAAIEYWLTFLGARCWCKPTRPAAFAAVARIASLEIHRACGLLDRPQQLEHVLGVLDLAFPKLHQDFAVQLDPAAQQPSSMAARDWLARGYYPIPLPIRRRAHEAALLAARRRARRAILKWYVAHHRSGYLQTLRRQGKSNKG